METITQTLHRLTSYEPGREWDEPIGDPRVVQDLEVNDLARFPWFYKRYVQPLPRVPLLRSLPPTTAPAVAVLAGTANVAHAELDLPQLSRLFHLSAGVVRTTVRPYATWLFRAPSSASRSTPCCSRASAFRSTQPRPVARRGRRTRFAWSHLDESNGPGSGPRPRIGSRS